MYICLYGEQNEKYELVYTYNMHPVLALEAKTMYSQLPVLGKYSKFIYHPDTSQDVMYIDFTSKYSQMIDAFVSCQEQGNAKDKFNSTVLVFPDEEHHQKKFTSGTQSVIEYTSEELKNYKNPVCLLSVKTHSNLSVILANGEANEDYYMAWEFSV